MAVGQFHGLIGDAGDAAFHHNLCELLVRGQMQKGEERQIGSQILVFVWLRLLHLHHHVSRPGVRGRGHDLRALLGVIFIRKTASFAGPRLHPHFMPRMDQGLDTTQRHADAVFIILDLFG